MKISYHIFAAFLLMILSSALYTQAEKTDTNKWYVPEFVRLQYAGNIGMFSVGPSWVFAKGHIELAPSFGYAPTSAAGRDINIAAFKCFYSPKLDIRIFKKYALKPFAIGAVLSYTFKDKINDGQATDNYPEVYFWKNIHYRTGLLYEAELFAKLNSKHICGLSIYFEASLWDVYLVSKLDHGNHSYLNLWDITTFGLGTKVYF